MLQQTENRAMGSPGRRSLRVLVADDDDASRRFIGDGLRQFGVEPVLCAHGGSALTCARTEVFDLLLLDCRMPGGGALQLLTELRDTHDAASKNTMAVATTADPLLHDDQHLLSAGFCHILIKPCTLNALLQVLALVSTGHHATSMLDDAAGMASSGDPQTLHALRTLLRQELILLDRELDTLSHDRENLRERLHRLRSSCGFCGASALATQTVRLQRQLDRVQSREPDLSCFRTAIHQTVRALTP